MTEPFKMLRKDFPSQEAARAYCRVNPEGVVSPAGLYAAYEVDFPAVVRAEVERAWHWWHESDADGTMPLEASFVDYLAARFPEAAPDGTPKDARCFAFKEGGRCYKDHGHLGDHHFPSVPTPSAPAEKCGLPKGHVTADEFALVEKVLWVIFPEVVEDRTWDDPYDFVEAAMDVWKSGRPSAGARPEAFK